MRNYLIILTVICALFAAPLHAAEQLVDRVVAVVNQDVITQSELDMLFQPIVMQYQEAYQGSELMEKLKDARHRLILQLIEDRLAIQEAKKLNIEIPESEINERVDELKQSFTAEGKMTFDEALKTQNITLNELKDRIKDQLSIQRLHYYEVRRKVVVSPLEIENYYKEHQAEFSQQEKRKIWVITMSKNEQAVQKGTMDEKAKKKAESILKELKRGKNFEEIAKKESDDPHAKKGGLIGYVAKGDMVEHIDKVLFQMLEGQITDVLETERAYHIFKIGERQVGQALTLEQARPQIENLLFKQKANKRFEDWMDELKKKAFISIR